MSHTQMYEWHKRFKSGRDDMEDLKPGCPTTSTNDENIHKVNELVGSDHRMTVRMMAEELGLGRESVRTILTGDLGMKICVKMVPKLLSDDQKTGRVDLSRDVFGATGGKPRVLGRCHHWRRQLGLPV